MESAKRMKLIGFGMMFLSILDLGMSEEEAEKSESRLPKHGNGYPKAVTDKSTV